MRCVSERFALAYATGLSMSFSSNCARHAPIVSLLQSVSMIHGLLKSGDLSTGAEVSAALSDSRALDLSFRANHLC